MTIIVKCASVLTAGNAQRETDRQTERQTDRQTDREREGTEYLMTDDADIVEGVIISA